MTLKSIINNIIKEIDTRIDAYKKSLNVDFNVFLQLDEDLSYIDKPCNIILSPVFYWVKKESLPVNSTTKAAKLAPSCFGSQVPEGNYSYFAIKDGDDFILFAYDKVNIANALKKSNIDASFINKIYFAQNEFFSDLIEISDDKCLYNKDGIYVILPYSLLGDNSEAQNIQIALSNTARSKHNININLDSGIIDSKYINILGISIFVITAALATRYFVLKDNYSKIIQKEKEIIRKYSIPTSSLQLKSIKKNFENKLSKEIKIKDNIQNVFDIPLKKEDFVKDIEIMDNKFNISIYMKDQNNTTNAEYYKQYLIQHFELKSLKVQDNILNIKGEF